MIFIIIASVGHIVSATALTYGGVIAGRVLNGIGSSIPLGIGTATICDLFTQGERGFYIGIYTLAVTNGPHIAPIVGGYISQTLGWRWCFWIPGIIQTCLWVLLIFTLPETLFSRVDFYAVPFGEKVWFDVSFATLAAINAALLLPLIFMVFHGDEIREKQGLPKEHGDL